MIDENKDVINACSTKSAGCTFEVVSGGVVICVPGTSTCSPVSFLEAEESGFHDCNLIEATAAINEILAKIPPDADGRTLSFLRTEMGTLLAWVEHGGQPVDGAVTANDDNEAIAKALNLKL
jgi:hypothetical protein